MTTINGYQIIGSVRVWKEYSIELNTETGEPQYIAWLENDCESSLADVEEWSFRGGEWDIDDKTFYTFTECRDYIMTLPALTEAIAE